MEHKVRVWEDSVRALVAILGFALWCAPTSWAEPVYFVVDASKSMDVDERSEAKRFITDIKKELAEGTETSTSFFGSVENGGDCGPVEINPLKPANEDIPEKYEPGNFTPLGTALQEALTVAAENDGRVIVISDGADTCEVDVCDVVRRYVRRHPKARLPEFKPIGASDDIIDGYGCFVSAKATGVTGIIAPPPPVPVDDPPPWVYGAIAFCGLLVGLSVVLEISAMEARARDLNNQIKTLNENGKACESKVSRRRYLFAAIPATLAALIIVLTFCFARENFFLGCDKVWWFVNLPFGSMLLPAIFIGFIGWALLQMWNIDETRRQFNDTSLKVELEKQREAERKAAADAKATEREQRRRDREAERRASYLQRISDLRRIAQFRQSQSLEAILRDSNLVDLSATVEKMNSIADAIEELVSSLDNGTLAAFVDTARTDYPSILSRLFNRNIISATAFTFLDAIFKEWIAFLAGRSELSEEIRQSITDFDVESLRLPQQVAGDGQL